MKLLDRTLIILLLSAFIVLAVSSFLQYVWVKNKIESRVDRKLLAEKSLIIEQLKNIEPKEGFSYNTERASVKFFSNTKKTCADSIFNSIVENYENEKSNYRILKTCLVINGKNFKVEIKKEIEETETFMQSVFITFIITLIVFVFVFFLLKYFFLKNTWQPFFNSLETLKNNDLQNEQVIFSKKEKIKEFQELNKELNLLAEKVYNEYQSQKTFIENVNHELMTPLSVIQGKLELIIQSENLSESDLKLISDIFISIERLTKINKSLVLLSKIENHQFEDENNIIITELIDDILNSFEDQIRIKNLKVRKEYKYKTVIRGNETLMFVLFSNLIKNSIYHNNEHNGFISIIANQENIEITNSGATPENFNPNIFERFIKNNPSDESIGLGLSITKKICDVSNITIKYINGKNTHTFIVNK